MFTYIRQHPHVRRGIALFLALTHFVFLVEPSAVLALTSGPSQPEFTSFEPVVTTDMVNEFSGDFTYNLPVLNIPGPDGSGYALSLSYHSGTTPEEEASWVGSGWTLNPGAINRQMVGVPDDWNGEEMRYFNTAPTNATMSVSGMIQPELVSFDIPVALDGTIRYNNYTGFGNSFGVGVQFCNGIVSLGYHVNDGNGSFSLTVNPAAALNKRREELSNEIKTTKNELKTKGLEESQIKALNDRLKILNADASKLDAKASKMNKITKGTNIASAYGMHAIDAGTFPMSGHNMRGQSWTVAMGFNATILPIDLGIQGNVSGSFAFHDNVDKNGNLPADHLLPTYGYLYQNNASDPEAVMDYHTDNATTYNKRDKHLPQSYNDIDLFVATGEGVVGSMRLNADHSTTNRPAATNGSTIMNHVGFALNMGLSAGGGGNAFIVGQQEMFQGSWNGNVPDNSALTDEPFFFRMAGDKGGYAKHAHGAIEEKALVHVNGTRGYKNGNYQVLGNSGAMEYGDIRSGRSSHVGFNTYAEQADAFKKYEKALPSTFLDVPLTAVAPTQIAEISVLNESGKRYNYALPVLSKEESNMSYYHAASDAHNYRHTENVVNTNNPALAFKTGTTTTEPYATAYLLTSVLGSDYIDRLDDGPTSDDIGGYTKFIYKRAQNDYSWRSPYSGYAYSDPELSECYDNRAQVSAGKKEINYLDRIETKSHVAIFERSNREDGKSASGQSLEKLDAIKLYLKSDVINGIVNANAVSIKTVRFSYANDNPIPYDPQNTDPEYINSYVRSVWTGTENSDYTLHDNTKLTLERVWFESNGTKQARIAPYIFHYEYGIPNYGTTHPAAATLAPPSVNEAPDYSVYDTDPWGNYRNDGAARYGGLQPWLNQAPDPTDLFDPAAWQLKRIELPTGGEIHVQYEQDDYAYVQDEKAHALVRLSQVVEDESEHDSNEFIIDVSDLIQSNTPGEPPAFTRDEIMQQMRKTYSDLNGHRRKIFYKIMFLFEGSDCSSGDNRHREFITGYSTVVQNGVQPVGNNRIKITLENNSRPRKVCNQQFKAEKKGKSRDAAEDCGPNALVPGGPDSGGSPLSAIISFANNARSYAQGIVETNCNTICKENSYFRIPVGEKKLGGGIRVKRLLMVDPKAIEDGYPAVFGTEYIYKTLDDHGRLISSGVATNEPGGLREENVLVRPLDRYRQSFLSRAVAGKDRKQVEGPLGESAYPGASVGYSKVIAKSIHVGRTAPAFTVNEYYTYKERPIHVSMTDIDPKIDYLPMTTGIVNIIRNSIYASQGFTIHIPDMHGRSKRQASYNGDPRALLNWSNVYANLVGSIETDYFGEGEELPIMTRPDGTIGATMPLGQEMDVCMETREIKERMNNGTIEIDGDVAVLPLPFPSFSAMVTVSHTLTKSATHTITKVARYPAVVKRTRTFKDGIYHITQNLAFDAQTGNPTIVRSHDGFFPINDIQTAELGTAIEGIYTSVSVPGSMVFPALGQVAKGERKVIYSDCTSPDADLCITRGIASGPNAVLELTDPGVTGPDNALCDEIPAFCVGDLLRITNTSGSFVYNLESIDADELHIVRIGNSGDIGTEDILQVEILRSGCNNKLNEMAGGFTYYGQHSSTYEQEWQARLGFVASLNSMIEAVASGNVWQGMVLCEPGVDLKYPLINACQEYPPSPIPPVTQVSMPGSWDVDAGYNFITLNPTDNHWLYTGAQGMHINVTLPPGMCQKYELEYPGVFALNENGMLIYQRPGDCAPDPFICPQFCTELVPETSLTNVVASNATTYDDVWDYATAMYSDLAAWPANRNDFELGKRGKWRPNSHYAYMTPLTPGTKNYDQGMYDMILFNYNNIPANSTTPWIRTDLVTRYSPEGHILEELDALGRPSAAKFGYDRMLPTLVVQNSVNSLVLFESFEKTYPTAPVTLEDGVTFTSSWPSTGITPTLRHSGNFSYKSSTPTAQLFQSRTMDVPSPALFQDRTMLVKCWLNAFDASGAREVTNPTCSMRNQVGTYITPNIIMQRIARTGDWVQYSVEIPVPPGVLGIGFDITCTNTSGITTAIDDVRIQPVDAQMMTYVYDAKTLRLLTTFDDQHFGQYYQYNGEGKLVRKLIETERGMKTIQENQQNVPLQ